MAQTDTRKNLHQVFCYIRALAERQYETVLEYKQYSFNLPLRKSSIPEHEAVTVPFLTETQEDGEVILTVRKTDYPACPAPPDSLSEWIEKGWDDPTREVKFTEEKVVGDPESPEKLFERFSDSPERSDDREAWLAQRKLWVQEALPAYNARKLYETLYALYSELGREKDRLELIFGDGLFETTLPDGATVCHPLVLERVMLEFDSDTPSFSVIDCDSNPSLNTRLLRAVPELEWKCLSDYSRRIESELIHPFEGERLNQLLGSLANSLSSECEFCGTGKRTCARCTIRRAPVIFTRARASGYLAMLDKIIEDIDVAAEFSPSLTSIICEGDEQEIHDVTLGTDVMTINGIDPSVLLEKAANREQLLIAKKLQLNPSVLVQGPPGTGKTHTISNIVGDLLAQGKSILITSHTSKALSVLRDKISEPIRPLCVSVLDDNRRQLEQSLNAINDYMTENNCESLDEDAAKLELERRKLIEAIASAKRRLAELIEAEYISFDTPLGSYTPKQAAQLIAQLEPERLIPDTLTLDSQLPLSDDELALLFASNEKLTDEQEKLLASGAPDCVKLVKPDEFTRICSLLDSDEQPQTQSESRFWEPAQERLAGDVHKVLELAEEYKAQLDSAEEWMISLAQSGVRRSETADSVFAAIESSIGTLTALADDLRLSIVDTEPMIPDELICTDTEKLLNEICTGLDSEKINWLTVALHPRWKQLLDACLINGEKPDTRSEVLIMRDYHTLLLGRKQLVRRWTQAITSLGGPAVGGEAPESQAAGIWSTVTGWLSWYGNSWQPLVKQLTSLGFKFDAYIETLPVEARMKGEIATAKSALSTTLPEIIAAEYWRGDRDVCTQLLSSQARLLLPFCEQFELIASLRNAIDAHDAASYAEYYNRYDAICMKRAEYTTRTELLERLSAVCPVWAEDIAARKGASGLGKLPDKFDRQLLCAQLCGELDRLAAVKPYALQDEIAKMEAQLSIVTRDLIARKAWSAQLRTMLDQSKKRALATWVELVKRVGKGTGKRAEQLRASGELRVAMKNCRRSVPVWIMPLSSVAEYFEPGEEMFDVMIIDEASQADLTGLIALYLAKKVIVVGDDKQVSPTPIGLDIEVSRKLRQEFLSDIPAAAMYDEMTSIYDLAKANYEPITLKEHFRCAADIINFSNYYTYNGMICPLRDSGSIKLHPATVAHRVISSGQSKHKTNPDEAQAIAAMICACTQMREYDGATFGAITMLGDEQALLIDRILRQKLPENVYKSRRILCGNPSYFQGDERDVIFISLVDTPKEDGSSLTVRREGYNEMYAKRYNVAASRARDQMWVVHSLDPDNDLKADDIRLKLIRHAEAPQATAAALETVHPAELSDMEKAVSDMLTRAGYKVSARERVGSYIISLLCEGDGTRVAIECDGDRPTDSDALSREVAKQAVLERIGWRFIRLRASEYYRNPMKYLAALSARLGAMNVTPRAQEDSDQPTEQLTDRVIALAAELLEQWNSAAPEDAQLQQ